ncbi:hypothetical protein BOX15_Mlig034353g1 [Macrostomum lignano]|uniref:Uncharacterized protein n=1 Tax=Macrostomum lignano TaxID=282301 RepID=A0A267GMU9_9PLAT|nr:hypothetical protein BOX15_Mlig034353g1 [Macrostomum lignano]
MTSSPDSAAESMETDESSSSSRWPAQQLLKAVRCGDASAARRLLRRRDFPRQLLDTEAEADSGATALLLACQAGRLDLLLLLLRHGASVRACDRFGWDALNIACWYQQSHLLPPLLARLSSEGAGDEMGRKLERRCG